MKIKSYDFKFFEVLKDTGDFLRRLDILIMIDGYLYHIKQSHFATIGIEKNTKNIERFKEIEPRKEFYSCPFLKFVQRNILAGINCIEEDVRLANLKLEGLENEKKVWMDDLDKIVRKTAEGGGLDKL